MRSNSFWLWASKARIMVLRYRITSAEIWARSAAPRVYSVYMIRKSWSTWLRAWPLYQPRPAIKRLMRSWEPRGLGIGIRSKSLTKASLSLKNDATIDVRSEVRIVRNEHDRPGFIL